MALIRKKTKRPAAPTITADDTFGDPTAQRLVAALQARDWTTARGIFLAAPTSAHFSQYVVVASEVKGLQDWIDGPIRDEPTELALLVKGARYVKWAWEARGHGLGKDVTQEQFDAWLPRLNYAEKFLGEALDRNSSCAEAWHWLIVTSRARGLPIEERCDRFDALVALDPHHFHGHMQMLQGLAEKWSGSNEMMFTFARERAAAAPGTLLPALVAQAHIEVWIGGPRNYLSQPHIADDVVAAAHQSIWDPEFQSTFQTPLAVNTFAYALVMAEKLPEAKMLFDYIGDNGLTVMPWFYTSGAKEPADEYLRLRAYLQRKLPA